MNEQQQPFLKAADIRKKLIFSVSGKSIGWTSELLNEFENTATYLRGQTLREYITSMGGNGNVSISEICGIEGKSSAGFGEKIGRQLALVVLDKKREEDELDLVLGIKFIHKVNVITATGVGIKLRK